MKLTKKIEAEIRKVYQAYWDSYLCGDLKTMAGFLSDDFTLIGTSDGEVFNNKKSAMKYVKATIHQVAGVLSKKNIEIKITQADDTILVNEFSDAYIKLDGTPSFYDKFRVTTLMKQVRGKWKIIHQHGSLPDSKAEVGETLATEKVKKENRELREAVKRRTRELEQKSRDLEIEASLEKARARAMVMQSSSELADLIGMIYTELTRLDLKLDRCFIILFDEATGDATWWMASGDNSSLKRGYHVPFHKNSPHLPYLKAWSNQDSSWKHVLKGAEKKKWDEFMFSQTELAQLPKVEIKNMKAVKLIYASTAFNKYGCITVGTLEPLASASFYSLARFSSVFEQTYTRFLDLKNAEAQAKESQIQLALERVRARTMAMQHSDELQEAANLLFKQVQSLEILVWSCGYNIWEKHEKVCTGWMSTNDTTQPPFRIPLTESPTFKRFYKSRQKNEDFYVEKVEGDALVAHYKYMFSLPDFAKSREKQIKAGFTLPESQINHVANFAHGNLVFITSEPVPDAWDIFKRFAKVFEQTYTRFLDLKRAEAQTREAQIEAALERVRSRTMAMHRSDELREVVSVLYEQLTQLGFGSGGANIALMDPESGDTQWWMSGFGLDEFPDSYLVKYFNHPAVDEMLQRWKKGEKFASVQVAGESKKKFDQSFLFESDFRRAPEEVKLQLASLESATFSLAYMKYGALNMGAEAITSEQAEILQRFAVVFEQTYTRFLDLKKAEAQAREAHIEAALERVRSRTMAMHKSEELHETNILTFRQIESLNIPLIGSGIHICHKNEPLSDAWMIGISDFDPLKGSMPKVVYDHTRDPVSAKMYEGWKSKNDFLVEKIEGEQLRQHFDYISSLIPDLENQGDKVSLIPSVGKGLDETNFVVFHFAYFSHGFLVFATPLECPENHSVFKRFAKVFEQTYTRFLDLQKAEAQAREAQIEAALERVRSRTMAMHKSDELLDVITVVSEQLQHVGIKFGTVSFGKNSSSFDMDFWVAAPDLKFPIKIHAPYANIPIYVRLKEAFRERRTYFSDTFTAEETKVWNQHIIDHNPEFFSQKSRGYLTSRPGMTRSTVLLKDVFLFLINYDFVTYSREEIEIVIRFANVFEQTYTRFLDLQKAEGQAREAQIEAALERLRARTMAMQQSTELAEVSQLLNQQFLSLGVQTITCAFMFPNEEKKTQSGWSVLPDGTLLPKLLDFPLLGDAVLDERYTSWKEKRSLHRKVLDVEQNRRHHQFLSEQVASHISKDIFSQLPDQLTFTNANFAQGYLMTFTTTPLATEEENILVRFAKVFEQTYTRFLDLEKAESQGREAQVQLSLERVRARAMAMHDSEELSEVLSVLFEQFDALSISPVYTFLSLIDVEKNLITYRQTGKGGRKVLAEITFPLHSLEDWGDQEILARIKQGDFDAVHCKHFPVETFPEIWKVFGKIYDSLPEGAKVHPVDFPDGIYTVQGFCKYGYIGYDHHRESTEEEKTIVKRFAIEFGRLYQRFLDLLKAEAQAREAQIESALEKIRSRSLAMHHSGELKDVVAIMFEKMKELNVVLGTIAIQLFDQNTMNSTFWPGNNLHDEPPKVKLPYYEKMLEEEGVMKDSWECKMKGENLINKEYTFEQKTRFFDYVFASNDLVTISETDRDIIRQSVIGPPNGLIVCLINEKNSSVFADSWNGEFYSDESIRVLIRAAKVFEQAYVRFLDLQKAELQARESQIEAALERIRARTMAMHKSEELLEVIVVVSQQLTHLGFRFDVVSFARNSEMHDYRFWFCLEKAQQAHEIHVPYLNNPMFERVKSAMAQGAKFLADTLTVAENRKWIEHLLAHDAWPDLTDELKNFLLNRGYARSIVFMPQIMLLLGNYFLKPYSEEQNNILKRFAAVFEQSYTRFLDLQKAEAQARESQIEAALERVRAKAMAMHTAQQLKEVVHELRTQMGFLGQKDLDTCVIHLNDESPEFIQAWAAIRPPDRSDEIREFNIKVPKQGLTIIEEGLKAYADNQQDYVLENKGEKLKQWMEFMKNALPEAFALVQESSYDYDFQAFWSLADFQGGSLLMVTLAPPKEDSRILLRRFANVFGLAYRRFADLKQAEAQAREATIEAALEKIRSRSLGMHKSEEILDVVAILFEKLKELGLVFDGGAAIHLFSEGSKDDTIWVMSPELSRPIVNNLPYDEVVADNPIILDVWKAKDTGQHITNRHYSFEEKREYFEYVFKHNADVMSEEVKDFIRSANSYTANFIAEKNSLLGASSWTGQEFSEDDVEVLKRVARVFEQAYIRFLDLQKAEVHAKDAVCQASLDRVRAEIASMRRVEDLDRITPLIWRELNTIGIPSIRCGVFIMDEPNHIVHTFLSTPDGKAIGVFHLPFDVPGFVGSIVKHWRDKKMFLDYWDDVAKNNVAEQFVKRGLFASTQQYLDILPKEEFHLHFLPFGQGMLYVGNLTQLKDEELNLLQSLADSFATAYARYDDFNKLESAKQQVDRTLVDLKQAQQQLVQSEKMASLGELTAGIAHEIQNPLNFVNNFSEVSNELIDEMKTELNAGNLKEAAELAESIKQNLEKITHHGKRADGIVKGMLQHSRAGSGQKEPTDLNFLCDEYLRLAYHGYRAKDKSFNAKFETDFDATLPKVNVVPQDMGRVILNLINNAFYAVGEENKRLTQGYVPTVRVSTKRLGDRIEIHVGDNGPGIPASITEKIFQPFFTTKPTGQGTGLGLSLAYDIVTKLHGGELKVETKQGEGCAFVIIIPCTK
jgi:signal transduction histidine kinase/ketosteroid isomerase-like protein